MSRTFQGNTSWEQATRERWLRSGWELDRLIVAWQGDDENFEDFIGQFSLWDASDIDGDMFLETDPNDDDRNFPTVELVYIGKRGGELPPDRPLQQRSAQQVRYIGYATDPSDPATGFDAVPPGTDPQDVGTFTLEVTYAALAKGIVTWARDDSELDIGDIGDSLNFEGEVAVSHWYATWDNWPTQRFDLSNPDAWVEELFFLDTLATGDIEALVPDEYFKASVMVNSVLYPDPPALGS